MNAPFGSSFTDWLDAQIERRASAPENGAPVASARGRVIVAPGGQHMVVRGGRMFLTLDPERHSCRPSVDVLFETIAADYGVSAAACLLTGMGRDGALGLLKIRECGGTTIAQDEATSVIYGMPREAAVLGAATHVLPLSEIGPRLAALQGPAMETVQ
jgi:two-component system, chemotaxis family, protein-glutamate methylesterase/glutaminase